ncbi:hypothetical protein [Escherichia coli]
MDAFNFAIMADNNHVLKALTVITVTIERKDGYYFLISLEVN